MTQQQLMFSTSKPPKMSNSSQDQLLKIYQIRLKSLLHTVQIHYQNLSSDNQIGGLSVMKEQQMKSYRIDRQLQLLKDTLLLQKQKLVIKVLSQCHLLKKQNEKLIKYSQIQNKNQIIELIAQRDNQKYRSQTKTKPIQKLSQYLEIPIKQSTNLNINIYQKLLQDKIILTKQLENQNHQLNKELSRSKEVLIDLENQVTNLKKNINKDCQLCLQKQKDNQKLLATISSVQQQVKNLKQKLTNYKTCQKHLQDQVQKQNSQNKKLNLEICRLFQQLQQKDHQYDKLLAQVKDLEKTIQQNSNKVNQSQLINQLKSQIISLQKNLIIITNQFQILKQDITYDLKNQIDKLKQAYYTFKIEISKQFEEFKIFMKKLSSQLTQSSYQKIQKKQKNSHAMKRLKQLDNQLEFFIEQKKINQNIQ